MLDLFLASSVTAAVLRSWKPWSDAKGICCAPLVILMGWSCCTAPLTLVLFCNCVFVGFLIGPLLGSFSLGLFSLSVCFSDSLNLHLTVAEHLQERLLSWICIHARYDSVFFLKLWLYSSWFVFGIVICSICYEQSLVPPQTWNFFLWDEAFKHPIRMNESSPLLWK